MRDLKIVVLVSRFVKEREREGRRDVEVCVLLSSGCARKDVGMCKTLRRGLR